MATARTGFAFLPAHGIRYVRLAPRDAERRLPRSEYRLPSSLRCPDALFQDSPVVDALICFACHAFDACRSAVRLRDCHISARVSPIDLRQRSRRYAR